MERCSKFLHHEAEDAAELKDTSCLTYPELIGYLLSVRIDSFILDFWARFRLIPTDKQTEFFASVEVSLIFSAV